MKKQLLIAALLLLAALNFLRIPRLEKQDNRGIDLRTVYLGSRLMTEGLNPYDDSLLKARWEQLMPEEAARGKVPPGLPSVPLLYPPQALVLFAPAALMPFDAWMDVYLILNIIFIAGIAYFLFLISRKRGLEWKFWHWLLFLAAFRALIPALHVGQPSFLALMLITWALWLNENGHAKGAGVLAGITLFKFTLALPLLLYLLLVNRGEKKMHVIGGTIFSGFILFAGYFYFIPTGEFQSHADAYFSVAGQYRQYVYDPLREGYPYTYELSTITESGVLWPALRHWLWPLLFLPLLLRVWKFRQRLEEDRGVIWMLCAGACLCTTHHLYYDLLLFLPGLALLRIPQNWRAYVLLAIVLFVSVPFSQLLPAGSALLWLQKNNAIGALLLLLLFYTFPADAETENSGA